MESLDAEINPRLEQRVKVASSSASEEVWTKDTIRQLSRWRRDLSQKQIDQILSIAHAYDLDMYTDRLEPDCAQLRRLQREYETW